MDGTWPRIPRIGSSAADLASNTSGPRLDAIAPLTAKGETWGLSEIGVGGNDRFRFIVSGFCDWARWMSDDVSILVQFCVNISVDTNRVYSLLEE